MDLLVRIGVSRELHSEITVQAVNYLAKGLDPEAVAQALEGVAQQMRKLHAAEKERQRVERMEG